MKPKSGTSPSGITPKDLKSIEATEVRKIKPPNLDEAYLGQRMLGVRPMRHGSPQLSVE